MSYYFSKIAIRPLRPWSQRPCAVLKSDGFGVLTEIDVKATLRQKIGVDFRPYRILGACHPTLAHKALTAEDKVGVMLPCNVIVQDPGSGRIEVAAINPLAAVEKVGNPALAVVAVEVAGKPERVVKTLW
jgi:uncharacterized protein (DUF302 family)